MGVARGGGRTNGEKGGTNVLVAIRVTKTYIDAGQDDGENAFEPTETVTVMQKQQSQKTLLVQMFTYLSTQYLRCKVDKLSVPVVAKIPKFNLYFFDTFLYLIGIFFCASSLVGF